MSLKESMLLELVQQDLEELLRHLAVNINTYPTHIAGLPVAVNMCCHVNRHAVRSL